MRTRGAWRAQNITWSPERIGRNTKSDCVSSPFSSSRCERCTTANRYVESDDLSMYFPDLRGMFLHELNISFDMSNRCNVQQTWKTTEFFQFFWIFHFRIFNGSESLNVVPKFGKVVESFKFGKLLKVLARSLWNLLRRKFNF